MKKLLLALILLWSAPALAQNPTCPTRPVGDSTNACASTAFVNQNAPSLTLPSGDILVGNASNVATPVPMSGDCTLANTGAINCTASSIVTITGNRDYYVRTDGNDSTCNGLTNASSASAPNCAFLTIQQAVNVAYKNINWAGFNVTVHVADGTYTSPTVVTGRALGQATAFTITGNTGTPNNVVITTTSTLGAFTFTNNAWATLTGMKISTTTNGNCISNDFGSILNIGAVNYGASAGYHISTVNASNTTISNQAYTISGGAVAHYYTVLSSVLLSISNTITITGTPNFTTAFLVGAVVSYSHLVSTTISGATTGQQFYMYGGAQYSDGSANAYTYLPGNTVGTTFSGAVYNNDYEYNNPGLATPTITPVSGTTATAQIEYKLHGKDLHLNVHVTITAAGSATSLNIPFPTVNNYFNLAPINAAQYVAVLAGADTSASGSSALCIVAQNQTQVTLYTLTGGFVNGHTYTCSGLVWTF